LEVNVSISFQPLVNHLLITVEPEPPQSTIIDVQRSHEGLARFGEVTAVGPEVRDVKVGQRVLASITAGVDIPSGTLIPEEAVLGIVHQ
jgi:Zn-dependent alcohol dehydrogenase